jgi:hypothetical protein
MSGRAIIGLLLAAAGIARADVIITNNTSGMFDASSGTRTVTVTGLEPGFGLGIVRAVILSINFAKADGESMNPPYPTGTPYYNEIVFRLTSPGGTTVNLISANSFTTGSGSTGFDGTITFNQYAASVVNVNPNVVQAGTYRPVGNLNNFYGQNAAGTWSLYIQDTTGQDALRFRLYSLDIVTDVPEPSVFLLVGAGLVLLARRMRR